MHTRYTLISGLLATNALAYNAVLRGRTQALAVAVASLAGAPAVVNGAPLADSIGVLIKRHGAAEGAADEDAADAEADAGAEAGDRAGAGAGAGDGKRGGNKGNKGGNKGAANGGAAPPVELPTITTKL
ncbi:hypothetical protein EPUS_01151 [Endocarpon pusillum Z07020]|uniref:Uncharacterized protein n=1 Tax=Endocarpon pusillum (strain Z07020 / HMAS-L-300199) TaxID=1263415 RepID=U1HJU4_ENDPU|nr:uncharacterized protein EPUS_01151 [Endocarpon pusillum Z07020]ERF69194.1 hypothetical protein EPUS_01151 [Endocarpon pusillum Z07020]